jgi:hypothetical protein
MYIAPRAAIAPWKFSFHPDRCTFAYPDEEAAALDGSDSRFIDDWFPRAFAEGWHRLFTIVVPTSELRPVVPGNLEDVRFIPSGPLGSATNVVLLLGPPATSFDEAPHLAGYKTMRLFGVSLDSGRAAWLMAYVEPEIEPGNAARLEQVRAELTSLAATPPVLTMPDPQLFGFGVRPEDDSRFWLEVRPAD